MSSPEGGKQVSLAVFGNEPTARMAEQRLQGNGIPCLVRSLQGGPGLWGSSYNLPHDLLVYEQDEMLARDVLDLGSLEITEPEDPQLQRQFRPKPFSQWAIIVGVVSAIVVLILAVAVVRRIAE